MPNTQWKVWISNWLISHLLLSVICHPVWARETNEPSIFDLGELSFVTVGDNEKIPDGIVTSIAQDRSGFLWIGTQEGLVRYDGYRFRLFKHEPNDPVSLSGDFVRSLWASGFGEIWVGTFSDGISVYDYQTDTFRQFQQNPDVEKSLSSNTVLALTGDNRQNIFAGTDFGLNHIEAKSGTVSRLTNIPGCEQVIASTRINSLLLTDPGTLWVGSSHGLCRVTLPEKSDITSPGGPSLFTGETFSELNGQSIEGLFQASDGKLWIGTLENGIAFIESDSGTIKRLLHSSHDDNSKRQFRVTTMAQPGDGELWFGTDGNGIVVVNAHTGKVLRHIRNDPLFKFSVNSNQIGKLLLDDSGLLWIGTWGGGLNLYNPSKKALRKLVKKLDRTDSLSHNNVTSILELQNGSVWVGNSKTGIDVLDTAKGVISSYGPEPDDPAALAGGYVMSMHESQDGSVWIGTISKGLHRYDPETKRFHRYSIESGLPSNDIFALIETSAKQLWVGTDVGIALINTQTNELKSLKSYAGIDLLKGETVLAFAVSPDNHLWIGTSDSLFALSLEHHTVTQISVDRGTTQTLSDNYIKSLLLDDSGRLLIATGQGLDRLVAFDGKNAEFEALGKLVGIPSAAGSNLTQDYQGNIWTTMERVVPENSDWQDLRSLPEWDVGTKWIGSQAKMRDGTLLFGGSEGVVMVRPQWWQSWDYQTPLAISGMEVNNRVVPIPELLTLDASISSFSVEFAALDYSSPDKNQYAYMLEGFDQQWIITDANQRRATYTNLPAGNYRFKVKGTNSGGIWSDHQISLDVQRLPAWYEMLWFRLLMIAVFSVMLYVLFQWRLRQLKQQKVVLDNLVKSRTENISLLGTIGQEITSTLELETVLERVYKHVNELMDADVFAIDILDEARQNIICQFDIEKGRRIPGYQYALSDTNLPAVWCVTNEKEMVLNNGSELSQYVSEIPQPVSGEDTESVIYLPLVINNKVIGCITVQSFKKNAYGNNDLQMLRTIANYTAIALANAESVEMLEGTLRKLRQTQKQLIQQEKMAGLGTMTAGVMHEINNPTNFTHSSLYSLHEKLDELFVFLHQLAGGDDAPADVLALFDEKKQELESITSTATEGTTRIKKIVADLSSFVRNDKDEMNPANIRALIESSINLTRTKYPDIDFDIEKVSDIKINCYQAKLAQVFLNLLVNACQAIETLQSTDSQRVGRIVISSEVNKEHLAISISDNGCGMDDETLNRVFEPFFTTKEVGSGTGLGMSISYSILEEHGGKMEVESAINQGTRIRLLLPLTY